MDEPRPQAGFADRVARAVAATGPLCAGIDPSAALLAAWDLPDGPDGLRAFGSRCVEAFAGIVPVVKPQVAFFERHGAAGLAALEQVLAEARASGLLVIADAKRTDIASTVDAYAGAWLDPASPLCADAVTAVPYFGLASLEPMVVRAGAHGNGVVVVARGSNPEGRVVREAVTGGGRGPALEDLLLGEIAARNRSGDVPAGTVGAVVGATLAPSSFALPGLGGTILAPGVGAQGATAAGMAALFAGCAPGTVLASVSRSLLARGPDRAALAAAAHRELEEAAAALA
jgi:orotidine-5'-phosphate decarboxylase